MAEAVFFARIALAGMLALSGVAKAVDEVGTRAALRDFRVPSRLLAAWPALPAVELSLAVLLLVPPAGRIAALGALALLAVFTAAIAFTVASGRRASCHCFGALSAHEVGPRTLVRNAAFMAVAALAMFEPAAAPAWMQGISVARGLGVALAVSLTLAVLALGGLVLALWRQQAALLARLDALEGRAPAADVPPEVAPARPGVASEASHGLAVGVRAPRFAVRTRGGEVAQLEDYWSERPALVVFGDPRCRSCPAAYAEAAAWRRDHAQALEVVVVGRQGEGATPPAGLAYLVEANPGEAWDAFGVPGTPSAVLVGRGGTIASPLAAGLEAMRVLVETTVGSRWEIPLARRPLPTPVQRR